MFARAGSFSGLLRFHFILPCSTGGHYALHLDGGDLTRSIGDGGSAALNLTGGSSLVHLSRYVITFQYQVLWLCSFEL